MNEGLLERGDRLLCPMLLHKTNDRIRNNNEDNDIGIDLVIKNIRDARSNEENVNEHAFKLPYKVEKRVVLILPR